LWTVSRQPRRRDHDKDATNVRSDAHRHTPRCCCASAAGTPLPGQGLPSSQSSGMCLHRPEARRHFRSEGWSLRPTWNTAWSPMLRFMCQEGGQAPAVPCAPRDRAGKMAEYRLDLAPACRRRRFVARQRRCSISRIREIHHLTLMGSSLGLFLGQAVKDLLRTMPRCEPRWIRGRRWSPSLGQPTTGPFGRPWLSARDWGSNWWGRRVGDAQGCLHTKIRRE
jgi:hypothetical protein